MRDELDFYPVLLYNYSLFLKLWWVLLCRLMFRWGWKETLV